MNYMTLIDTVDEDLVTIYTEYILTVLRVGIEHRLEVQGDMIMQGKMIPMWLCDAIKFRAAI